MISLIGMESPLEEDDRFSTQFPEDQQTYLKNGIRNEKEKNLSAGELCSFSLMGIGGPKGAGHL